VAKAAAMLKVLLLPALAAIVAAGCVAQHPVDGPHTADVPFIGGPAVAWTDDPSNGYHVEVTAALQREVTDKDQLAFVVRVGDDEVGRYPITKGIGGTTVHQKLDLPLGDYDIALDYRGQSFAGEPFRIAVVPEWGGTRNLHLFRHHGTRISLVEKKLWVLRWWSNDAPTLPWIVEWRHDGRALTTTTGRERKWSVDDSTAFIKGALAPQARRSIWQLGEEYAVPDAVAKTPGTWEARVIHAGAPPIAVEFTVMADGTVGTMSKALVSTSYGWTHAWSIPLAPRPLATEDSLELYDQLPVVAGGQKIDEGPIELTPNAVRALFRSKELADRWSKFLGGNRELRGQIEKLIKSNGGPWKPEEFPKS
jgi:hypothetical protein